MDFNKVLLSLAILTVAQFCTWFQFFGQLRWKMFHNIWLVILIGIPVTILYYYATRIGIQGFGEAWPVRVSQFVCGILVFTVMSAYFLDEGLNARNIISVCLCLLIIFIQIFWK